MMNEMVNKVKIHAQAITEVSFIHPVEDVMLSILLENEKELRRLRTR